MNFFLYKYCFTHIDNELKDGLGQHVSPEVVQESQANQQTAEDVVDWVHHQDLQGNLAFRYHFNVDTENFLYKSLVLAFRYGFNVDTENFFL